MELGTAIKCPHYFLLFIFIMANPAYDQALATGKVVIRKWWVNTNSTKNQMTVQFQQTVERPETATTSSNALISLEQGTEALGNTTSVTALRSFSIDRAAAILKSREGDATMGSPVYYADDFYAALGAPQGTTLGIQVTENFTKNAYSRTQTPKVNPSSGEIVVATNPTTGTQMPVYRHTDLVFAHDCVHTFVAGETPVVATAPMGAQAQAGAQPIAPQAQPAAASPMQPFTGGIVS